jgi:hypothetical protein
MNSWLSELARCLRQSFNSTEDARVITCGVLFWLNCDFLLGGIASETLHDVLLFEDYLLFMRIRSWCSKCVISIQSSLTNATNREMMVLMSVIIGVCGALVY